MISRICFVGMDVRLPEARAQPVARDSPPVFGIDQPVGQCRRCPVLVMDFTHERIEEQGPIILMDGKRFAAELLSEGPKVTDRIPADMRG